VTWRDAIVLARRSVGRRGGRALLTVLAVALGAALLSSLLIASAAAKQRVLDQVASGGPLAGIKVDAAAPDPSALDSDDPNPGPPKLIDDNALHRIEALPNVSSVVPVVATPMILVPPKSYPPAAHATHADGAPLFDSVLGVDLSQERSLPITVLSGRLPAPGSTTEVDVTLDYLQRVGIPKADAAAVVGTNVVLGAPRVFVYNEGRRDRAFWSRAQVVGVVSQEAGDGLVLMPITRAQGARAWSEAGASFGNNRQTSPYSVLFVVARGLNEVTNVRAEINNVGYSTSAPESLITQVQRYLHVVEIVLAGIGLIGLAIAAIGISNAMLAAVRERRHEIGVLKAVGASDRDVRRVFLVEAGTLGFAGGVIGAAIGFGVAQILAGVVNNYLSGQGLETVNLGFPAALLTAVVAGATVLALGAGVLPASRAARLPARQAIADE
jgi:putative ABC transport system permease protein